MTAAEKQHETGTSQPYLSFSPDDLVAVRVRPAQLAKIFGVSRQSISMWVKKGFITLGPDGRADLREATDQMMRNTSTQNLRARAFRSASAKLWHLEQETKLLQARVTELESALAQSAEQRAEAESWARHLECTSDAMIDVLVESAEALKAAVDLAAFRDACAEAFFEAADRCTKSGDPVFEPAEVSSEGSAND